jgi:hypothetical protein
VLAGSRVACRGESNGTANGGVGKSVQIILRCAGYHASQDGTLYREGYSGEAPTGEEHQMTSTTAHTGHTLTQCLIAHLAQPEHTAKIAEYAEMYRFAQNSQITASPDDVLRWAAMDSVTIDEIDDALHAEPAEAEREREAIRSMLEERYNGMVPVTEAAIDAVVAGLRESE